MDLSPYNMLLMLLIHLSILLTVTAQQNLTPFGQPLQSSNGGGYAKNAIEPPISNEFDLNKCSNTRLGTIAEWWMFEFSFKAAFVTDITIYYRVNFPHRMDGFKIYVTNTSTIPPDGYLCYEDPDSGLPDITQTIPCYELGKYVIYYDDKGSTEPGGRKDGPVVELCYVAINGCQKSLWGSTCGQLCPENCIDRNCYPGNGSCVWGCNAENCLNDICDKDAAVCTDGCKESRTGRYCNKYNIASKGIVWQIPSGSTNVGLANDGIESTCVKTTGPNGRFHIDLQKKSIVTEVYIILDDTATEGHHTIYASNTSNAWKSGTVLYNGTYLPTDINVDAVFRFITYVPPVLSPVTELVLCEIGIIGCPPTHYGHLCNTTCPQNCRGPCDLDVGICKFGCINGWTGNRCENECNDGSYGKDCLEQCSANCWNTTCNHVTGKCIGGCKDGWQGFNCSQTCPDSQFGRNCSGFCEGCVSSMCHHVSGLCDNTTSCNPGYEQTEKCDLSCDDGEFGIGCKQKCYCVSAHCSKEYGICPPGGCEAGFNGESCNKECSNGTFGQNCKNICKGCISSMCDTIDGSCKNTTGCETGYLYDKYCNKTCDDGQFGKNCTGKCNCLTGTCDISTGICGDEFQIGSDETSNVAAIGGSIAAFIIVVLILVAVFIFYKRRLIASQDTGKTTSSDTITYETRITTNNSHQNEQQYDDLIRMDPASPYQDLIPNSASNEYEQIDNSYVNLSVQI
ncbi:uncharacterized protein LOC143083529 [Mytilus galloprovincialis]|uniref:uncharacterized protein LOC143083529 n=1 Tax=Mytilus galloprovincialis TaxID=29158 RepID=UPI003F7B953E